jgi:hypothetical protein
MQLSGAFFRDLKLTVTSRHCFLSSIFDDLRSQSAARVSDKLKQLDADHPMRLPVTAFGIIGYGRRETAYTRALAWLFSPGEPHGFGNAVVKEFLSHILGRGVARRFRIHRVYAERPIALRGKKFGRIDIWIEGVLLNGGKEETAIVVIEAKIDAQEGKDQLKEYCEAIDNLPFSFKFCCYLTPEGTPSKNPVDRWRSVSFQELARSIWRAASERREAGGYQFTRLLVAGILADLLEWPLPVEADTPRPVIIDTYL